MNNAVDLWNGLIQKAKEKEFEIHTIPSNQRTPLWFLVGVDGNLIVIKRAILNRPSIDISMNRKISFKDFEFVHGYYDIWLTGESGVRHEVSRKSRNTAYIFALVACIRNEINEI
jgi:hypothetical protein